MRERSSKTSWPTLARSLRGLLAAVCVVLPAPGSAQFARPDYESPPSRLATAVVPAELRTSPHYQVQDEVDVRDFAYVFRVNSEFGFFETRTLPLLQVRLREIAILAQAVNAFNRTNSQLGARLRGQLSVRGNSFADILTSPLSTAGNLAGQLGRNVGETLGVDKAARVPLDNPGASNSPSAVDPVMEAHRRTVASQLGLDIYSRNPRVQELLTSVARVRQSGRPGAAGISMVRTPAVKGPRVARGRLDAEVDSVVWRLSASEVDEAVMQELLQMGVSPVIARSFVANQALSPRHRLTIAAHLDFLGALPGRGLLVEAAAAARSEAEALTFQEMARMYALYHEVQVDLQAFMAIGGLPAAASARRWVLCLPVDILYWDRGSEQLGLALKEASAGQAPDGPVIVVAGEVTAAARRGLASLGVDVRAQFMRE